MNRTNRLSLTIALVAAFAAGTAMPAQAGKNVRSNARSNVNSTKNVNVNRNTNKNVNVNSNRHVDVDVDVDRRGGYYGGGCCYNDHPIATAAAVTATAVVTAAVVGSMVHTLPVGCSTVMVNGFVYQQCGSAWYQPQMSGTSTTYIVVNAPR